MRIVQVITKFQRRGAELFAAQLSQELASRGHEVLLISLYPGEGILPFDGRQIGVGANPHRRFFDWKAWSKFAKAVRDFKPDLIQLNASETLKFAVFSQLLFRWNYPMVYRNANQMGAFLDSSWKNKFNQFLIAQMAGVISVSHASAEDFKKKFPTKSPTVIPIGIDKMGIDRLVKESPKQTLPEHYLIQVGGLVSEKDPIGMLEIFEQNAKNNPELHLLYLGSGPLEASLREEIKLRNLDRLVHLIPNQFNIFPILSRAKALVMPSKIEGLPGVILEAMYCKVPVIAYNVGGISEVLGNQTGWLIPAGDQKAFAEAIDQVLQLNGMEKEQVTDQAFQLVNDNFTIGKIAGEFEEFYSGVSRWPLGARIETKNDFT